MTAVLAASDGVPPRLAVSGLTKRFGPLVALDDVSLDLRGGSVHALLGENGAGKSTLVKCIMGYHPPDRGTIRIDGEARTIAHPRDAQDLGVGMVYQHFTVVPNMTVAENFVLSRAHLPAILHWRREEERVRAFMSEMPFRIEPRRTVGTLSAGERQKLEILKQLYLGNRVLILDEPTSVLTPAEADQVLGMLRAMCEADALSVLIVTHKFREVTSFADEVTVLRRGRVAGRGQVSDLTPATMASMMVGGEPPSARSDRRARAAGPVRLALEELRADNDKGVPVLKGVSLEVRAGEIVGIAGVSGNGQDELLQVLAGQRPLDSGRILVDGVPYRRTRAEARAAGLRCLPEEPLRNACVPTMSVADNIALRVYDAPAFIVGGRFVARAALRERAVERMAAFGVKASSVDAAMSTLSGGNVQRAVLSRELDGEARILVVANPCFGLDFAAVAEVRARLLQARDAGVAVLLVSADLDEIFPLSDRVLVMSEGRIVHQSPIEQADIGVIGRHMAGQSA